MRSLRVKILATAALLILLSQIGTVTAVLVTANSDVSERAEGSLIAGTELLSNATTSRAGQLGNTVRALASDYGFKQAVGTRETETIRSALQNHAQRAGADIAFIIDLDYQLLAASGGVDETGSLDDTSGTVQTFAETNHRLYVSDGKAYEIYTVPVKAPLPVAWLSMGFRLDDAFAHHLQNLTGLEVTLISRPDGNETVVATSKTDSNKAEILKASKTLAKNQAPTTVDIGGNDHLAIIAPFMHQQNDVQVLITKSLAEAMAPYALLKKASFVLGALPLLAALLGAVLLSRALTHPINRLMEAAKRIQSGDYGVPVEIRSGDELREFGGAFNAMQSEIAAREKRIVHQATHDSVTGLHNREYALEQLAPLAAAALHAGKTIGLMVIRLNALGDLSGSLGHDTGAAYLNEVANRLRRFAGNEYILARLENDDFLIALTESETMHVREAAEDLVGQLGSAIRLSSINVNVKPVVGIALLPDHANNAEQLLLRATIARNEAQSEGRSLRVYRDGDQEKRVRNLNLLQDLKRAAQENELQLHYQPKIALHDVSVCGVEALVRWQHPEYGWLPPGEFIPLIEKSGNILILTRWVIQQAGKQLAKWDADGLDLSIAVNLSANDLLDDELPWFFMDVVREHKLNPKRLVLEVTEEAMVEDFGKANSALERLHDLGLTISIDDFGTGYSSLSQLKKLPVQELKIDRSFIAGLPSDSADTAIVSASVSLAHQLGLKIVAEGVTNGDALRWLRENGVDRAQGFYWSEPIPADAFNEWLRNFTGGETVQVKPLKIV